MARIPDKYSLSAQGSLRSGRTIASYDTSGLTRGIQGLAAGLSDLSGAMVQEEAEKRRKDTIVGAALADADYTTSALDIENKADADPDYEKAPAKYGAELDKALNRSAESIKDPEARAQWIALKRDDLARQKDALVDRSTKRRDSARIVQLDTSLEKYRRIYVDPTTSEDAKEKARADIEGTIQMAEQGGLLTPELGADKRFKYLEEADYSRGLMEVERNPDIISKPLPSNVSQRSKDAMGYFESRGWTKAQAAGIVGNLLAESSLNTDANNPGDGSDGSDSIGIAQWNGDRAKALKKFAAMNHADWRDFGVQLAFVDHELNTSHKSIGDNLRKAGDVQGATDVAVMFEGPRGSNKGARFAHNYKGRLNYALQAAGEKVNPDWYDRLSPEQKQVVQEQADVERRRYSAQDKADIDIASSNAPAAIQTTGQYTGQMPSEDKFINAYGPNEGPRRYDEFQTAVDTSQKVFDIKTMSGSEIQAMIDEAKPTSSGDDAALQSARYDVLTKAAATSLVAREADPVSYVTAAFPNVQQAWDNAETTGDYQAAIAATTAASQQLGIRNPAVLPKEVASISTNRFKDVNLPEAERISAVTGLVFSTKDPAQRNAIFNQLVDAGLPDATQGAVEAFARGDDGAGRRLFQAAIIDPSKLPGITPEKKSTIDEEVQAKLMDKGQIGNVYYGLSDGTADNFQRAQRDSKLIANSVMMRMSNGEPMESAIDNTAKDLYGDVQLVEGDGRVNTQLLLPAGVDPKPVVDGLAARLPDVEKVVSDTLGKVKLDLDPGMGNEAVMKAVRENYVKNVSSEGYFKTVPGGYVFIDPFRGAAIADEQGKAILFQPADVAPTEDAMPLDGAPPVEQTQEENDVSNFGTIGADILKQWRAEDEAEQQLKGQ